MWKKTMFLLLLVVVILLSSVSFCAFVDVNYGQYDTEDYNEYLNHFEEMQAPEGFVWYHDISPLGLFMSFHFNGGISYGETGFYPTDFHEYNYHVLNSSVGNVRFKFARYLGYYEERLPKKIEEVYNLEWTAVVDSDPWEDLRYCSTKRGYVLLKLSDDVAFVYRDGYFYSVVWRQSSYCWAQFWLTDFEFYGKQLKEDDYFYRLLQRDTCEESLQQLFQMTKREIEAPQSTDAATDTVSSVTDALPEPEPTVKWWHIALPVGGGIAVVGSLAAVLLLRKKKK